MIYLVLEKMLDYNNSYQELYIGEDENKAVYAYRKRGEFPGRELIFKKIDLEKTEDYFPKDGLENRALLFEARLRGFLNSAIHSTGDYRIARFGKDKTKLCFRITISVKDFVMSENEVFDCIGFWIKTCKQRYCATDIPVLIRLAIEDKKTVTDKEF